MLGSTRYWILALVSSLVWRLLAGPAEQDIGLLLSSDRPSNVLLLTAHPDDECMFFAPTLLALQELSSHQLPTIHSLCLSVGNADGLGDIRRRELSASLDVLGIAEGKRWVIDTPELQDNFTAVWDAQVIADAIRPYVLKHNINTILTFDHHGISSHLNHISLPHGAAHFLTTLPSSAEKPPPRLFTLVTVPLYEKYLGVLSPLLSKASIALSRIPRDPRTASGAARVVAVSGFGGYARAHRAMREHWSQLVWFRWLYVSFSRYMWVNEWVELTPPTLAQTASGTQP
ncbi:LmbE-like protein [Dichomitus squalens LYAD-421 SS1]|uniref:N-acetylglucosaminylphosphatidylinositol deacetylase n=2 Tax=Dichomitus squalens TaxID=114155 RepID=A0A4Q9Q6T2_9APHY|nr:LmbE-like protein [Dichomitus squalens LYAD-421 SS1]EJF57393.1 LmbE-like protein [Dichomitus squalens LYAD-421 SS1]TBU27016.1 LmbE-like protein [Dichomitus squalens]TBU62671.1 LmbE-like protein [Dichomitus squalens]